MTNVVAEGSEYPCSTRDKLIRSLSEGGHVLFLGSGSGIDAISTAIKVGRTGQVVGLDTDQDLIKSSRLSAASRELKSPQLSFIQGNPYRDLPITSNSADCIISNWPITIEKETFLKEAHRVLRPGGSINVDAMLSPTSGEADNSVKQLFADAGFKDISLTNIEAEDEGGVPGHSPSISSAGNTTPKTLIPYQIYALKTGTTTTEERPDMLLRWWDAFPSVVSAPSNISAEEVAVLIRSPAATNTHYAVIDVRRNDHGGGHVRGSNQSPAQTFYDNLPEFFEKYKNTEKVIFYCSSSRGRGPRCAGWYQDYLDSIGTEHGSKAYVLRGGVKEWLSKFTGHEDLVDYD